LQSLRGRGGAAGRRSCGSGDVGLWSAGSSRGNGSITSGRRRSRLRSFSVGVAGIFSFLFILAGVRTFSVLSIIILLRLADIPDEDLYVGIIHIAVGQLLAALDKLRVCGPCRSFAHRAQSFKISLFIPGEEVREGFIGSNPSAGIPPFSDANLR
jgi:hypothetical protein